MRHESRWDITRAWFGEWLPETLDWFANWFNTPGFGGAAALIAAIVAYKSAKHKIVEERKEGKKDRDAATERHGADAKAERERVERENWWKMLIWVYDRSIGDGAEPRLSLDVTLELLAALEVETKNDFETGLLEAVMTMFSIQEQPVVPVASAGMRTKRRLRLSLRAWLARKFA
ncbi:hypothetical protein KIH74_20040 [Kineosporia sp. J2-2]|uniref:Uncharacterized protein n=1 Tax=Kineosporia corallincola TaxID=2835133 RepID=A0ABS5TJG8_9ACTN|nr:hypothetical protein [Kineosporia corallincola]MBT0771241.1 hypothetical protein [Kineosporia corallincola]